MMPLSSLLSGNLVQDRLPRLLLLVNERRGRATLDWCSCRASQSSFPAPGRRQPCADLRSACRRSLRACRRAPPTQLNPRTDPTCASTGAHGCWYVVREEPSWSAYLPRLVVVSNRVWVPDVAGKGSAGGLAVALREAFRAYQGLWFGWTGKVASQPASQPRMVDKGRVPVRANGPDVARSSRVL
jgi:hypothetical protein